ncbi:hypothetical protein LV92_02636 [Arenibacter echinorum]|uniref:Uncharacterized protein n=1 Tax=Arenibacter echinorum TaxID=440515 RepID=A0A327R7M8_9FLAO|nr:hypothetical protein LV92_02636 [Arenibacter echinorum]
MADTVTTYIKSLLRQIVLYVNYFKVFSDNEHSKSLNGMFFLNKGLSYNV